MGNLDMFEDSSLDNPTRYNCSLFSRNSKGNVTARLGSKMKLMKLIKVSLKLMKLMKLKSHLVDLLACERATLRHTNVARVVGERLCDIRPCSGKPGSKEVKVTFDHQYVSKCPCWHKIIIKQRHSKNK